MREDINSQPPRWPARLLEWFCDPDLINEILGDLAEMYQQWAGTYGVRKARRLYVLHAIKFIRPFIFRRRRSPLQTHSVPMIKNYFTISLRNIARNKVFASINVLGLSLGMACAILIYTFVTYHLGFDNFHPNPNRIYRIVTETHFENTDYSQWVPQPLGKAFNNDFSFAEKTARIRSYRSVIVSLPEEKEMKKFQEDNVVAFAEPTFFEIFNLPLISGRESGILDKPYTTVVTRSIALKYFNTIDVVGKTLRVTALDKSVDFHITGVLKDIPANSDHRNQIYLSYANLKDYNAYYASDDSWGSLNRGMQCFVLLKSGIAPGVVEKALPSLVNKYYNEEDAKIFQFRLQAMADIHFDPAFGGTFNKKYVWMLVLTGFFMITIACVNFINLATAQILNRSKEVGVRKVLGSFRYQLFLQFIIETGMIAVLAVLVSYVVVQLALPFINGILKERLSVDLLDQWQMPAFIVTMLFLLVFISGTYPAILLTRFQPARALKGKFAGSDNGGLTLRRLLIVTQFVIAQILIISMIVIDNQLQYSKTSDLGFDKDAIVMMPIPDSNEEKMKLLSSRIEQVPGVDQTTLCFDAPATSIYTTTSVRYDNHVKDEPWEINLKDGDDKYLQTFGLKLIAGRDLLPTDTMRAFLVNETFVKRLGIKSVDEVIGRKLSIVGGTINGTIEGVVKDFHNNSFHEPISAICIMTNFDRFRTIGVKVDLAQVQPLINTFSELWSETYPDHVFSYQFLDDRVAAFYESDVAMLTLVKGIAFIAILISCLGIFGMVSFMAIRKTKEIGVRKVLGANVSSILWLFEKEFVVLVLIAFMIAAPVGWLLMDKWLQGFVYSVPISPDTFVLTIGSTMIVAALTVSYHSLRSALANPVKSLRNE